VLQRAGGARGRLGRHEEVALPLPLGPDSWGRTVDRRLRERERLRHVDTETLPQDRPQPLHRLTAEQELQQEIEETSADSSDEAAEEESEESSEESEEELGNPVLGPVIADLGYKRIHFVSSGKLGTIPVWSRNRTYRNNRAKSMASEKIRSMELGFPGVICLLEASNGKLSIVDGQHRVGMMAALKEKINKKIEKGDDIGNAESVFERVLVEVYPEPETDGDAFAKHIFTEINKAEPVKLIDMPGVASDADRELITEAVETLQEQFESMFSASQRCRVPNVNVDNLRSAIFGANILQRNKLTTSKDLVDWLLEQNGRRRRC